MVYILDFGSLSGVGMRSCNTNFLDCSLTWNKKNVCVDKVGSLAGRVGFRILGGGGVSLSGRSI